MTVQRPKPNKKSTVESTELTPALPSKPSSVAELPGLGPIRLRALQKAGFDTLVKLKAATQSELEQVPGITPTKAEQIRTALAPFRFVQEEEEEESSTPSAPTLKPLEKAQPASEPKLEQYLPVGELLVLMQSASRLLCRHDRSDMRVRLQNQLEKLIPLPAELQTMWPKLNDEDKKEWPGRILKLAKHLDKLHKERKLSRQLQGDLADAIIEATRGAKDDNSFDDDED